LQIPKSREGIDVENHNFGYHFHYGKIKSNELVRSNILLTFNPSYDLPKTKSKPKIEVKRALYSEYHGEGHTKHIDVATIGDNKRLPIYLVCLDAAQKRGFENFKRLKAEAQIFYLPPD
jgi:hypothetical protein